MYERRRRYYLCRCMGARSILFIIFYTCTHSHIFQQLYSTYTTKSLRKFLITTLTNNNNNMISYSKSRLEVAKAINALTVDTPLFKCAGDIPAGAVGTTDGGGGSEQQPSTSTDIVQHNSSNPTSYAAIHLQLHKKYKLYSEKYAEHILKYAAEWERILTTRKIVYLFALHFIVRDQHVSLSLLKSHDNT